MMKPLLQIKAKAIYDSAVEETRLSQSAVFVLTKRVRNPAHGL
jgi:hypothetical protein